MKLDKYTAYKAASVIDDDREFEESINEIKIDRRFDELNRRITFGASSSEIIVFPADPGFGKSLKSAEKLGIMVKYGSLDKGALVVVSRLWEIDAYIKNAGLTDHDYAVFTGDAGYNVKGLGSGKVDEATVLLTTQQMFRSRVKGKLFADCSEFHFHGAPRGLRLWDETIDPAEAVCISRDQLTALFLPLRPVEPKFVATLEEFIGICDRAAGDDMISISSAFARMAIGVESARKKLLDKPQRETLKGLGLMEGTEAVKTPFYGTGWALAGCSHQLPADIAPLIVLDASARVRRTYDLWQKRCPDVQVLEPLALRYDDLTFHLWKTGSGKSTLRKADKRNAILDRAADLLNRDPHEDWLVISHKADFVMDIEDELRKRLVNPSQFKFVNWGNHHGTNDYGHLKKVLVVGPQLYSPAAYRAKYAAAAGTVGPVNPTDLQAVERGEIAHNLLQAICRSHVRNQNKGFCGKADVYVIMADRNDPEGLLNETFPNCAISAWSPARPVKGKAGEIIRHLEAYFSDPKNLSISKADLRAATGMTIKANLTRILRHEQVKAYLLSKGLENRYNSIDRAGS
ncbi:hypothetical protein HRJ34_08075 [Rhizorhabdus wittichii]|uniref:Uncharacterized protein n=1 Tax=Rhizorhabdus wittichii TaxID=160791 RepID=A0A975HFJ0_9SPHN|nr:hypothetical protein [Rhizorhabdus wittichii]QTH23443.1 hypothetical protein HRJ34_08075 [Rhizorhabdus wittichii]